VAAGGVDVEAVAAHFCVTSFYWAPGVVSLLRIPAYLGLEVRFGARLMPLSDDFSGFFVWFGQGCVCSDSWVCCLRVGCFLCFLVA
jgi:hypothetical protein